MLVSGEWFPCDDGVTRPVLRGEILGRDGVWIPDLFLIDTGADRTVLSADMLAALDLPQDVARERLAGIGGAGDSVIIETRIRLPREHDGSVAFSGRFPALTVPEALDYCVLGRDITALFAVIVDRPGGTVSLLAQRHGYVIRQS